MRTATIKRSTAETDVNLTLNLDGRGDSAVETGVGFLDHMLTLFARHGHFDLNVSCTGDINVDAHHTVEDIGICLGAAFYDAIGDLRGITRYADVTLPMDESLVLAAVDVSGRAYLGYDLPVDTPRVGEMDTELVEEFFTAFTRKAEITLHLRKFAGTNTHHTIEAAFKAFARALSKAVAISKEHSDEIPSTKGVLK